MKGSYYSIEYDYISDFSNGLAKVEKDGDFSFIKENGEFIDYSEDMWTLAKYIAKKLAKGYNIGNIE